MGTRKRPSLDDAGKYLYEFMWRNASVTMAENRTEWNNLDTNSKRSYIKHAIEIWREVERAI